MSLELCFQFNIFTFLCLCILFTSWLSLWCGKRNRSLQFIIRNGPWVYTPSESCLGTCGMGGVVSSREAPNKIHCVGWQWKIEYFNLEKGVCDLRNSCFQIHSEPITVIWNPRLRNIGNSEPIFVLVGSRSEGSKFHSVSSLLRFRMKNHLDWRRLLFLTLL